MRDAAINGYHESASEEPATDAAREWDGWFYGTQSLKPSIEPVYFGQKPFERGLNGAQNVQKWGTGAINVGGCKIPSRGKARFPEGIVSETELVFGNGDGRYSGRPRTADCDPSSRWPANLILDGSDEVLACFPETTSGGGDKSRHGTTKDANCYGIYNSPPPDVREIDSGSAARFFASFPQDDVQRIFYTSKAGADDRLGSKHPTVKPLDLIQYLVRLITPKNGICLDLFAGTGTTADACFREGFKSILIEREAEYIADIERRMSLVMKARIRAHMPA